MTKYGYHLTTKNNLYGIKKYGLVPKLGRRSYSVREKEKFLYFVLDSEHLKYWQKALYEYFNNNNMPIETEAVFLKFLLDGVEYTERRQREWITENVVSADKIIVMSPENPDIEYELSDLDIELNVDESKLKSLLEAKELFKNLDYIGPILYSSSINNDGRIVLDRDVVNRLRCKINTKYENIIWKNDLIEEVSDIYYTIIESNILYQYDISEDWLLEFLIKTEYER